MKAVVIERPKHAVVREVPYPEPADNELTIRVQRCGICGTDLHIFEGDFLSEYPLTPGHEFSGIVDRVGHHVTKFKVGDRVAVDPSLFCGECDFCLSNRGNHCEKWGALGDTTNGAMAEFAKVPEHVVFPLPDNMTFAQGAFIEPMACVVHGMNQLNLRVGQTVLLFGAGSMGQLLIQALTHAGASELTVIDLDGGKLALAKRNGATHTYLSQEIGTSLGHRTGHRGFDVVIDVTGIPAVIQSQYQYLAPAGTHLQFGVAPKAATVSISPFEIYRNDWRLIGSMAVNHTYKSALDWMTAGRFNVDPLISKVITLDEVPGFLAAGKSADVMKVQIRME